MLNVIFPVNTKQKYYGIHYKYILNIFKFAGCKVIYENIPPLSETCFRCVIDGKDTAFNFSDSGEPQDTGLSTFVFHFNPSMQRDGDGCIPIPPVSFHNWKQFYALSEKIAYKKPARFWGGHKNLVLYNQREYGNAIERRQSVRKMLDTSDLNVDLRRTKQLKYWKKINNAKVGVFVGGYKNKMLDRAQLQLMAFGCPTISADFDEVLLKGGNNQSLRHIHCSDDYSNLLEVITGLQEDDLRLLGVETKQRFIDFYTPKPLVNYIASSIS